MELKSKTFKTREEVSKYIEEIKREETGMLRFGIECVFGNLENYEKCLLKDLKMNTNMETQQEKVVTSEEPVKTTTDNRNKKIEIISGQFKGFKGIIKDDCVLLDKYLIQLDEFNAIYADKRDVKIVEDEWKDIRISGYNTLGFDSYEIVIRKDYIDISGTENSNGFGEKTYTNKVEDMEIIKSCIKNVGIYKKKVVDYLLNSLLRDKYYKEYHEVSDEFKRLRHNKMILSDNIRNNTYVVKSLEKELGI